MRLRVRLCLLAAPLALALGTGAPPADAPAPGDTRSEGRLQDDAERVVPSAFFEVGILVEPGVFMPDEAQAIVLPFMQENPKLFGGRSVLEIGTGSGVIGLYAAKLGASRVVATDISEAALANARRNAERMELATVFEARLVPASDTSAYSVLAPDESFDVIVSNPPYSLDLDADENTAVIDTGDLGLSIVRGLPQRLRPGGAVVLLYNSLFYHHVMVKFARQQGLEVRNHSPVVLAPYEAETIFNAYLARLLAREGVEAGGFRFDRRRDAFLNRIQIPERIRPLLPGNSSRYYSGLMVLRRPGG
jgi:release factor glutamine methyltransferase